MDKLDSMQLERLEAIGAYLYEVRLEQARSLEEIAAKTYIPLRLLKALESGQGTSLPEPVFIQGFIRRYADALGLDGLELAQEFPVHTAVVAHEVGADSTVDNVPLSSRADVLPSRDVESPGFLRERNRPSVPYVASGAIALIALGGLIYGLSRLGAAPEQARTTETRTAETATTEPTTGEPSSSPAASSTASPAATTPPSAAASPSPTTSSSSTASPSPTASSSRPATSSSSPQATASPNRPNAPVTVDVSLTDRSWVQVVVDGEIEFEGILTKGTKQSWSGQEEVTIVAGNAGAVMVSYNQAKAEAMGEAGLVEEMTFTPRNNSNSRGSNP